MKKKQHRDALSNNEVWRGMNNDYDPQTANKSKEKERRRKRLERENNG